MRTGVKITHFTIVITYVECFISMNLEGYAIQDLLTNLVFKTEPDYG